MYDEEEEEYDASRKQPKYTDTEYKYQTEDAHGERMDVAISREPSDGVSTSISNGESGLDLSFPSAEEAEEAFMSKEDKLRADLKELEFEAIERKKRNLERQKLRDLKKEVRKAKIESAIAPISDRLEPVVSGGKKAVDIAKRFGEGAKERYSDEDKEGGEETFKLGGGLDLGRKSNLGTVGRKEVDVSIGKGDKGFRARDSELSSVLHRRDSAVSFGAKKSGGLFDMSSKSEKLVDWGGNKKELAISFDSKFGGSLFGDEKKTKQKPRKKKKKKSKKKRR